MRRVIDRLKNNADVEIYCGMDCICSACPENKNGICSSQEKVTMLDSHTVKYLKLDKENYLYSAIENIIAEHLSEDVYNMICGNCEWKKQGICTYADVRKRFSEQTDFSRQQQFYPE